MMSRVRDRDNLGEVALRKALWRRGYRYRLQVRELPGRPDLVFPRHRVVVFVDGDYWHGRALREGGDAALRQVIRGSRFEWWHAKLARNVVRDDEVTRALSAADWTVLRIWESELANGFDSTVERVVTTLQQAASRHH